jgi:toxin YoeB
MTRRLTFTPDGWDDYLYWQSQDKKTLQRINHVLREILREPFIGIGKPEPLRENLTGYWSRRIDDTHRLVYAIEEQAIIVVACRYHY